MDTALHEVVGYIEKNMESSGYTLAAFLDIEGAFNNVKLEAIHSALVDIGIPSLLTEWIDRMLESRIINSSLGESSVRKSVNRGTPQGGVLSPLLWLLVINEILMKFNHLRIKAVAYDDDVVLLVGGKFITTISDILEGALSTLSNWACTKGLGVNPTKTELVLFTRKYKIPSFRLPSLGGVTLTLSDEAKYLGTVLDRKLLWNRNVEERSKKGLMALYSCKNSIGKSWGLRPGIIHWLYTTIVLPILTYGCLVWWQGVNKKKLLTRLSLVQRSASILITGALRSTPQAALNAILNLQPLDILIKFQAARCALRLRETDALKSLNYGHASILNITPIYDLSRGDSHISDYIPPHRVFNDIKVEFPSRESWTNGSLPLPGLSIFTDGSKMEEGTGAGVYCRELGIRNSYKLNNDCSVFQAEILAITKAAEIVKALNTDFTGPVTIYVDSQAALKAVKSHTINSKAVHDCKTALNDIRQIVGLCWVPGHNDIEGNEIADELARGGSQSSSLLIERSVKPPISYFIGRIRAFYCEVVGNRWLREPACRISKSIWPEFSHKRTSSLLDHNKREIKIVVGIITGHCKVRSLTSKWDSSGEDYCRLCEDEEEVETIEHILCKCPSLISRRHKQFGCYEIDNLVFFSKIDPNLILGFVKKLTWLK